MCLPCDREMAWAPQRQQFGRLLRRAYSPDQAKALMLRRMRDIGGAGKQDQTARRANSRLYVRQSKHSGGDLHSGFML